MTELRVGYQPESDFDGLLQAEVRSHAFCGHGGIWVAPQYVRETFIAALRAVPIVADKPPLLEGGYWCKDKKGALEQCHLRIVVRPYNARGKLLVRVEFATEFLTTPDDDLQQAATIRFVTDYAPLAQFADGLDDALEGNGHVAALCGSAEYGGAPPVRRSGL